MGNPDIERNEQAPALAVGDSMLTDLLANLLHEWDDQDGSEAEAADSETGHAYETQGSSLPEPQVAGSETTLVDEAQESALPEPHVVETETTLVHAAQESSMPEPELLASEEESEPPPAVEPEPAQPEAEVSATEPLATGADRPAPLSARRESILRLLAAMYPEAAHRIVGEEAAAMAAPRTKRDTGACFVVFHLGGESFAVPLRHVLEADRLPQPTPVPFVPEFVRGVTNRRGEVLPLIDLRVLLGLEPGPGVRDGRMLVVRRGEAEPAAALLVDGLGGIAWLADLPSGQPCGPLASRISDLLGGAGQHRQSTVHVVDVNRLFARIERGELSI